MEKLIKIIREEVKNTFKRNFKGENFYKTLQKDLPELQSFDFISYGKTKDEGEGWIFKRIDKRYPELPKIGMKTLIIIKYYPKKTDWIFSVKMKGVKGQKGEVKLKETDSYEEFIKRIQTHFTNNLLWKTEGFNDDVFKIENDEIIKLSKKLLTLKDKLENESDPKFNDLKKIYNIAIKTNLDDRAEGEDYCWKLYDMFNKVKQKIFSTLALMSDLDYYSSIPSYLRVINPSKSEFSHDI